MPYLRDSTAFISRKSCEETLEGLVRASLIQATSISPASPPHFPPCGISSQSPDFRFVTGIPTAEAFLEHTGVRYGNLRCDPDRYQHECGFFEPEYGCKFSVHAMEDTALVGHPIISSQLGGNSRGEFVNLFSGDQSNQIFYTQDADVKVTRRVRRQCFNCKATETSTWRRSQLSVGKMLCNKCGLFERTHFIPRPEKFPRRKTLESRSQRRLAVGSKKNPPKGGAVNPSRQDINLPPKPFIAHFVDALDPTSEKSTLRDMPRASPIAPDASLSPPQVFSCYPTPERPNLYHVDCQSQSSAFSDEGIWMYHSGSLR